MHIIFIILFMLFCHVFDDYFLQGCLANLKQKDWWIEQFTVKCTDKYKLTDYEKINKCKHDYIMALACHAFSWSFMIMLPIAIATSWNMGWLFLAYPINMLIHMYVDDLKANKKKINLVIDQSIHFAQIGLTFLIYCLMFVI